MPDGTPAVDPGEPAEYRAGVLSGLSLARSVVDRVSHRRADEAWLAAAWADEGTRVLVLDHGQTLIRFAGDGAALELTSPAKAPEGVRFLLEECGTIARKEGYAPGDPMMQRTRAMVTTPGSMFAASMLRDIERGARTECEHILGDLLHRGRDNATHPVLRVAYAHVATYEAQRARKPAA